MNLRSISGFALLCLLLTHVPRSVAQVYEKVFSFTDARAADLMAGLNKGREPFANLVQDSAGNFYGTTYGGGADNYGTVFRMTPAGELTTLVEFTGDGSTNKGRAPYAALVEGSDGNFYGTTYFGGTSDNGTLFKVTPAGVLTTLWDFVNSNQGTLPAAGLVADGNGDFYGTTTVGGVNTNGTVFKLTAAGTLTTLVDFTGNGGNEKGSSPTCLLRGSDGNLYGTTTGGGASNRGTLFKLTPAGAMTTLVEFAGNNPGKKGEAPNSLMQASDGNLYGTTRAGGANNLGTLFKLTLAGDFTTLIEFNGLNGREPAGITQGGDGNLYGATNTGGGDYDQGSFSNGSGTIFKLTLAGDFTTLVGSSGGGSQLFGPNGVVQGSDGNFYVTSGYGGAYNLGAVFKVTPTGELDTLVEFTGNGASNKGRYAYSGLTQGSDGNFYGTTFGGGAKGLGTVFRLTPAGVLRTLVDFTGDGTTNRGSHPWAGVVEGDDGNFYGTTSDGGTGGNGTVFKLTPSGTLTTVVEFTSDGVSNRGSYPLGDLLRGSDGNIYGTTASGGASGNGTVFKLTPDGMLTTLVEFTGDGASNKGSYPSVGLIEGSEGDFYGTTTYGGASGAGTIFKVTPAGDLTTLVQFSGDGAPYSGSSPNVLVQSGGFFWGTTYYGGVNGFGTVFKMTPDGTLTTLIEFTGDGADNRGSYPWAGLVLGPDGNLYGSTFAGGSADLGTVFKIAPDDSLTTVFDFLVDPIDSGPRATIIAGSDGHLYGTTSGPTGGDGSIYRLIFPGPPSVLTIAPKVPNTTSAILTAQVNPRGAATAVALEYSSDGASFSSPLSIAVHLTGYQTQLVGLTLGNLAPGSIYFYRFRAVSSAGTTVSAVQSFSTLAEPVVATAPASPILPTSAQFNGTVNAQSTDTTAVFEWGTDGNTFPNTVPAVPGTVTGNTPVPVSAPLAGLVKDTTYYYRIVATNAAGTVVSGTQSFQTLTDPVTAVTEAVALDTTSARVFGMVNAKRAVTTVKFEYGTDGMNFPNSVDGVPAQVSGETNVSVSAVLTGLAQGTTYRFRIRATSAGSPPNGITSVPGAFSLGILSGLAQAFPGTAPEHDGTLMVNLGPASLLSAPGIRPGWRFVGEQQWRVSGVAVNGLATADREIEFRPVPGYLQPLRETVTVISGAPTTLVEREYYHTTGAGTGAISVTLKPDGLAGAQWRLLGEDDNSWRNSGAIAGGLTAGVYLVECKAVAGRTTPPALSVAVQAAETSTAVATYFLADPVTGTAPGVLTFATVTTDDATQPYAYVGQLRSDAGVATGFAVKRRVVATAGHVVFDDGRLAYTKGLQWLHQADAGTYEPKPLIPRGSYVFNGYAAQRAAEATPGQSTPQSQQLDVAAIYFLEDAARGGSSGFLASDADTNEFLESNALKTLVGYPIDGIALANQGRMHATPPANVHFDRVLGTTSTANDAYPAGSVFRLYTTSAIRSSGGNSGGPLCVQYQGGRYYPAAIFLGGTGQTVVRTIDSGVIDLFNRAAVSGDGGDNNSNAGITQVDAGPSLASIGGGGMKITLTPASAVTAGIGWRIGSGAFQSSGQTLLGLTPGDYVVEFKNVIGGITPADAPVTVLAGKVATGTFRYTLKKPVLAGTTARGAKNVPIVIQPTVTNIVETFAVQVSGGETLATLGLSLNPATGRVSGTPTKIGSYILTFTGSNSDAASDPLDIALELANPGALHVATSGDGSIKPATLVGDTFQVLGNRYTLTAKPARGLVLRDWTGTSTDAAGIITPIASNVPTLEFTMGVSTEVTATFIPNPFPAVDGKFIGLVGDIAAPGLGLGGVELNLTSNGKVTGTLRLNGTKYPFKGTITGNGHFHAEIARKDAATIVLDGTIDLSASPRKIIGTVTSGSTSLDFAAHHVFEPAVDGTNSFAGNYTLALPHPIAAAQGHGYSTFAVKPNGTLKLTGALGDGEKLSFRGALTADHTWTFFAEPYKRAGLVAGRLTFHDDTIDFLDGNLAWLKPATPNATISAQGSRFAPPVGSGNFTLTFSADGTTALLTKSAILDAGRFTLMPADASTLLLHAKTGALSGRFPNGAPKPTAFKGIFLPKQHTGFGQFPNGTATGAVELTEVP